MGTESGTQLAGWWALYYEIIALTDAKSRYDSALKLCHHPALPPPDDNLPHHRHKMGGPRAAVAAPIPPQTLLQNAYEDLRTLAHYARFVDDLANIGSSDTNFRRIILRFFPSYIKFQISDSNLNTNNQKVRGHGVRILDIFVVQQDRHPYLLLACIGDKRREDDMSQYNIKQYTNITTFLPKQLSVYNTIKSQTIRFARLITSEPSFHLETTLMLLKLAINCGAKVKILFQKLRPVLFNKRSRYNHGHPVHRPGYHLTCIRKLFRTFYCKADGIKQLSDCSLQVQQSRRPSIR